jgi:hypothetical protein
MGSKRKGVGKIRLVKGVPGGDCDSCSAWLLQNIDKTKGARAKVGDIARDQFAILLDDCTRALLEHALPPREKDTTTKEWAGRILAKLQVSLEAHQRKLNRENPAYREWKAKWGKTRADIIVPKSAISQMVQEELRTAESYQFRLWHLRKSVESQPDLRPVSVNKRAVFERVRDQLVLQIFAGCLGTKLKGEALERRCGGLWTKEGRAAMEKTARKARPGFLYSDEITESVSCTWQHMAEQEGIPKVYWPAVDLPRFCADYVDEWWDWLWSRILEDREVLLPSRDPSKAQRQIHDHFLALVDARENGTF